RATTLPAFVGDPETTFVRAPRRRWLCSIDTTATSVAPGTGPAASLSGRRLTYCPMVQKITSTWRLKNENCISSKNNSGHDCAVCWPSYRGAGYHRCDDSQDDPCNTVVAHVDGVPSFPFKWAPKSHVQRYRHLREDGQQSGYARGL